MLLNQILDYKNWSNIKTLCRINYHLIYSKMDNIDYAICYFKIYLLIFYFYVLVLFSYNFFEVNVLIFFRAWKMLMRPFKQEFCHSWGCNTNILKFNWSYSAIHEWKKFLPKVWIIYQKRNLKRTCPQGSYIRIFSLQYTLNQNRMAVEFLVICTKVSRRGFFLISYHAHTFFNILLSFYFFIT